MPPQALAVVATLVSFAAHGNRIELKLDHGSAELVWISPTSFHFRRALNGPLEPPDVPAREPQTTELQIDDTPVALRMRSKSLDVSISKRGLLVSVRRADGAPLMADLTEPKPSDTGVMWEREARPGVRFYGLGAMADPELDLRGKTIMALDPFLLSTAGYAEEHPGPGPFRFDFTAPDRYRIQTRVVNYYFTFGLTPKEILKQRDPSVTIGPTAGFKHPATWDGLRQELLDTVHQAMSTPVPRAFNLAAYATVPDELKQRARQFGSLLDAVIPGTVGLTSLRHQLNSFFDIYAIETRDQHRPIWHPLPFQFPEDPECSHHADEFMLGDEMLIAPIYESGNKRPVYLPPGAWTSLETNQEYPGRQTIAVETAALPVFARNGTIVPLDSNGGIGLHYFPKAGGQFFLLEKEVAQYTQIHAAPAADVMRLEIESKKERDYQWVVHHVERPADVGIDDQKYRPVATQVLTDRTWFYDAAQKNLIIRVHVKAGEDNIINLSW